MSLQRYIPRSAVSAAARARVHRGFALALIWTMASLTSLSAAPLNIFFFGNSFLEGEGGPRSIPNLVASIATAAGQETPNVVAISMDGADLGFHVTNTSFLLDLWAPPGESWDYVVMQDYSTLPTHIGDVAAHRANALALYQSAAAHSPRVVPVLFETWARGPANEIYDGPSPAFPGGPDQMQQELNDAYHLAAADINQAAGQSITRIAAAGNAFQNTGFDALLYDQEQYHASLVGSLTAALVTYATIYHDPNVLNVDLSDLLSELELSEEAGLIAKEVAVSVVPEPSSWALMTTALVGLAVLRSRRRL